MEKYRRLKIFLTSGCNLDCAHCYLGEKKPVHMEPSIATRLLREAKELGVGIIDLTGGEPTIHPNFASILKEAGNCNFERVNISTNGANLLQDDILTTLKSRQIHCNISLDGATQKTVDAIRGKGNFKKLESLFGILKLQNISFSLRFSLNRDNADEAEDMLHYAECWKVNADIEMTQLAGNATTKILLNREQFQGIVAAIRRIKPLLSIDVDECFTSPIPCDGGMSNILSVDVHGRGFACLMMARYKKYPPVTAGNFLHQEASLGEMWEELQGEKRKLRKFSVTLPTCQTCIYQPQCQSGCWVTAFSRGCITIE
jgi:radical SAM protein with 4Fe4S-binding SPASM domain